MGCPECYTAFRDGLDGLLKAMHKGTRHVGKTPSKIAKSRHVQGNINHLREELANAVRDERYEDAARLKNEIDRILNPTPDTV
jgi:protein arginine kinase activator